MEQPQPGGVGRVGALAGRFCGQGIVMLAVMLPQRQMAPRNKALEMPGWIIASVADWEQKLDPAYANSRGSFLIDPAGNVLTKVAPYGNQPYGLIDQMLGLMTKRAPG